MKKIIMGGLLTLCLVISGCGKSSSESSTDTTEYAKEVYASLNTASDATDIISSAVLNAWNWSIYEGDNYTMDYEIGCSELGKAIGFGKSDVMDAMSVVLEGTAFDEDETTMQWAALAEPSYCVACAIQCLDSMSDELENTMTNSKDIIKEISEENPDASYLEDLKNYYTELESYRQFSISPSGNYIDAQSTVETYKSNIKKYKNSLAIDLE